MKLRTYGLFVIFGLGVAPVLAASFLSAAGAQRTTLAAVRRGNARLATRAAARAANALESHIEVLHSLGAVLAPTVAASAPQLDSVLRNYRLIHPHLRSLDLVGRDGRELATARLDAARGARGGEPAVSEALAGRRYLGPVHLTADFAPVMTVGVPVRVAGELAAAAVAEVDLIDLWAAVNEVRVGEAGFARLLAESGVLIAHGDPEERRRVFVREQDPHFAAIRDAGKEGTTYRDSQGREVLASAAEVPDLGWLVVEQPVAEAYAPVRRMRRDIFAVAGLAAVLAFVLGVILVRGPMRSLDEMRHLTAAVGRGELGARVALPSLAELRALATSLNQMAAELERLTDEIRARERLTTFGRVAAGLAHDLRTPLESVRAACRDVLLHPDDPEARTFLATVTERDLGRLARYVADLRRLATDGDMPLETISVAPRALADRVVAEAATAPKWRLISFHAEGEAGPVQADERLLERAVQNLVANGANACVEKGRGAVTVSLADEGAALRIVVADEGVGMSAARLREVLAGDFKSSRRGSGFGLGLGIARHVVAAHGGTLDASSEPGVGTRFVIRIPRAAPAAEEREHEGA